MEVICIFGDYGVGKDTFSNFLIEEMRKKLRYDTVRKVLSYTTRPRRNANDNTHTFLTNQEWEKIDDNLFIAKTEINGYKYGATYSQFYSDYNIYVVDEYGLEQVLNHFSFNELVIIKVVRSEPLVGVAGSRIRREKRTSSLGDLNRFVTFEVQNNGSLEHLREVAAHISDKIINY